MQWWRSVLVAGLSVILLLSGCVNTPESNDAGEPEAPATPSNNGSWSLAYSILDCPEVAGLILLEPERLQPLLPDGFTVRDAADFFGAPVPTGRGVLFFNSVACNGDGAAEVAVYTYPPEMEGGRTAVDYDFYTLAYATTNASLAERLQVPGAAAFAGTVTAEAESTLDVAGTGTADVAAGPMTYTFAARGSAPSPFEISARFWQVAENGTAIWEYHLAGRQAFAGTLESCTFPAGSILEEILGQGDCAGLQAASLTFAEQAFDALVAFTPTSETSS